MVFDLMDKIRELALSGDRTAMALQSQYERYLEQIDQSNDQGMKSALEFERAILATCKDKLQLFDQHQLTDLCRLQEDRHDVPIHHSRDSENRTVLLPNKRVFTYVTRSSTFWLSRLYRGKPHWPN